MLSRKLSSNSHGQDSSYFLGWEEYTKNPFHAIDNPNGIIQMGLAENQLSVDQIKGWLKRRNLTGCEPGVSDFKELASFQDYHGLPAFKSALAAFMGKIRDGRVTFDEEKIVLTAGATSANEILMFCLADPGDAFLLPTPYYPGFDRDLKWRTGVEIIPIHTSSSNNFRITTSSLEQAFRHAQTLGMTVKGVLITNPSNPLGTTITRSEFNQLIRFVDSKNIHLISDEIYAGTVFNNSPDGFISVAEALHCGNHSLSQRIHLVYSLSKDMGMPGFRVGLIYSNNPSLVSAATKMSSFGLVSAQTQYLLANMLSDESFVHSYIEENRKRIRERKQLMVSRLHEVGIPCLESNAGLFCWVDMRGLLDESGPSFGGEKRLWTRLIHEVGLNVCAGSSCHCSEPGWFRICFANMDEWAMEVAMDRIKSFADSIRGQEQAAGTVLGQRFILLLLLSFIFVDDLGRTLSSQVKS
ncbi:hypothetical protein MLD38_024700 [Melastoma candidum]|uniref:Uncharacterized protein n=1 Tax=Melastoma candidum TaxID=119954 RepID=A0ACB9NZX7_9MYRT|nr:hypothetical protein MLD38_024700 [Melastoma candidum]